MVHFPTRFFIVADEGAAIVEWIGKRVPFSSLVYKPTVVSVVVTR